MGLCERASRPEGGKSDRHQFRQGALCGRPPQTLNCARMVGIETFQYTKNYTYDSLNQLTSEQKMNLSLTQRLYEYQYQFDAAGNRTQMDYFDGSVTQTTYYPLYNEANQLKIRNVDSNQYTYDYDANGNMTFEKLGSTTLRGFTWNADNRLIYNSLSFDKNGNSIPNVVYTYDALGRRIMRYDYSNDINTMYFYDGLTVIAENQKVGSGSWDWQRIFTVGPGVIGNIFRISEKSGSNWVDTYYHYDAIGSVALRTNASAGNVESIDQEAYGNVKIGSQTGYHLTTKEYDSIPELYYFWQRWYDPEIGRFILKNPIPTYTEHPYSYVNNNPLINIDPLGLKLSTLSPIDELLYYLGVTLIGASDFECFGRCLMDRGWMKYGLYEPFPPKDVTVICIGFGAGAICKKLAGGFWGGVFGEGMSAWYDIIDCAIQCGKKKCE